MAVNLSPVGGVAAQFFTNTGAVLTGGKLFTYAAGTTTPQAAYTTSGGSTAWTNPIVLDAAGRVSGSGEIWLTDGISYKFVLKDTNDVLIATYDNITGINSNALAFTNQQQIITATANQTVFNLSINYQPGTNSLSVFVDGVNQYGPGAQYAYTETDSDTVTFVSGLHVGAQVKFTTTQQQGAGAVDSSQVTYDPPFTGSVATNVEAKLAQTVSVKDFGAVGNGTTDDSVAIQNAIKYVCTNKLSLYFPKATYAIGTTLLIPQNNDPTFVGANPIVTIDGGDSTFKMLSDITLFESAYYNAGVLTSNFGTAYDTYPSGNIVLQNFTVISPTGSQLVQPVLKIQDWHYGCLIRNIRSGVNQQMMFSANNFSTMFDTIQSFLQAPKAGARFVFSGNHNLNKITNFVAQNSVTAYRFDGPVTACQITNMSVEGCTYGFEFNATVYDVNIENSYFEAISATAIVFTSYVDACLIQNNYVAFTAGSYFVDYPLLPGVNIIIADNNTYQGTYTEASILKTVNATYGGGVIVQRPAISTSNINDLIIDNTLVSDKVQWIQPISMAGMLTKKTNIYAIGQYAGKYSDGLSARHGFSWTNLSSGTIQLNTKILYTNTLRIYVNLSISATSSNFIVGEFIGGFSSATFYQYGVSGVSVTSALNITNVGGFVQINGTVTGTITAVGGEIRLI
jgi:hypothetical protein